MDVIKKFPEDMDSRTAYKLMKSPEVKKMSEAEGSVLEIAAWIQYNSPDKETGEVWFTGTVYKPNSWEDDKDSYTAQY